MSTYKTVDLGSIILLKNLAFGNLLPLTWSGGFEVGIGKGTGITFGGAVVSSWFH